MNIIEKVNAFIHSFISSGIQKYSLQGAYANHWKGTKTLTRHKLVFYLRQSRIK